MKTLSIAARITLILSLVLLATSIDVHPVEAYIYILRVAPDGIAENYCGDTWANPCDLQYALQNRVSGYSDSQWELWLKAGPYYPTSGTDRTASFTLKNNLTIYGGFSGNEDYLEQRILTEQGTTTLSGDIGDTGVSTDNVYHVITSGGAGTTSVIDGVTVTGGYANDPSVEALNAGGGLYNDSSAAITIRHAKFQANAAGRGGGIYNASGSLALEDVILSNNYADNVGGGIGNEEGGLNLSNVTFTGNTTLTSGGGIYSYWGTLNLTGVSFSNNSAYYGGGIFTGYTTLQFDQIVFSQNSAVSGGGLYTNGGAITLTNLTFSQNSASQKGGGYYTAYGNVNLSGATLTGNSAASGGGIYNFQGNPTFSGITFSGNTVTTQGGGFSSYQGNPTITDSVFQNNSSYGNCGGLQDDGGMATVSDVDFLQNTASFNGGGMCLSLSSSILQGVTFKENSAQSGGGLWGSTSNSASLTGVTFQANTALFYGGGIYNESSSYALTNATFSSNSAGYEGGGISNSYSNPVLTNVTISGNLANFYGGGISNANSNPALTNVTISGNSATSGRGMGNSSSSPVIQNSILWDISAGDIAGSTVKNSIIQGGYDGTGNLDQDPLLGTLGNYGGTTQTLPLLPGSPAIDAGDDATCPTTDQRGVSRSQGVSCDIGAYEARPFTLTVAGGGGQTAIVTYSFSDSLVVQVAGTGGDPVDGGFVTFTAPGSGASAVLSSSPAAISGGYASTDLTANNLVGNYSVQAVAAPGEAVDFSLTNEQITTSLSLESSTALTKPGKPVTFTATLNVGKSGYTDPTGTVAFYKQISDSESTLLGTVSLTGGTATFTTSSLTVGAHTVFAVYSGDVIYLGVNSLTSGTIIDPYTLWLPLIQR